MVGRFLVRILAGSAIVMTSVGLWAAGSYGITDLGTLGGERTSAMGINNRGDVVGFSQTAKGENRAFLYTGGSLVDMGTLGGAESLAYRISDNGVVVGRAQDSAGRFHAFVTTTNGNAIELTMLDPRADGDFGMATGVNRLGEVTGYFSTSGDHMTPSVRNSVQTPQASRMVAAIVARRTPSDSRRVASAQATRAGPRTGGMA